MNDLRLEDNIHYRKKPVFTDIEKLKVLELHKQGKTLRQISNILKRSACNISKIIRKNNLAPNRDLERKRKYLVDHYFFSRIDTQEKAYILGFLFTDGNVSQVSPVVRLQLAQKDKSILEKITQLIQPTKPLSTDGRNSSVSLTINSQIIKTDLCNLGCSPNKTYTLTYPTSIPEMYQKHFIRGVIDGDGCIFVKDISKVCVVITGCIDFLIGVEKTIFKATNVVGKLYNNNSNHPQIKDLRYYGKLKCQMILDWVYNDAILYLDRKFSNYKILKNTL